MKLLVAVAVVLALFTIPPAIALRGPKARSLQQSVNTTEVGYNDTQVIIQHTYLSNVTNATIFAPDNKFWDVFFTIPNAFFNGTGIDALLQALDQNPALAQAYGGALANYIVQGIHMKAEFTQPVQYTTLAGSTLAVQNNGTNYVLTFPLGTAGGDNVNGSFTVVSFDQTWQGNVIHAIDPNNVTTGTA